MAKKTAKKKSAPKKKKAKRGAPSKSCPKCQKEQHAAKGTCDCGYKFPAKKKKVAKAKATGRVAASSAGEGELSQKLADSIRLVEKAGGVEQAKEVLAAVKEIEKMK